MMKRIALLVAFGALIIIALGYRSAIAPAIERRYFHKIADWPARTPPVRLVLLSDLHIVEPETPPATIAALVQRINALRPDCVLIAGDLVSDKALSTRHISFDEALAPLAQLRPKIATIVVRGNHDHWRNAMAADRAIAKYGMIGINNWAARCGALTIGGIDDVHTRHDDLPRTRAAMAALGGVPVLLSHSPDIFPQTRGVSLTLAGHTHCGQIVLPLWGAIAIPSRFGNRYACGLIREEARTLIVTGGIGTSVIPLRWGAPSDFWVVNVGQLTGELDQSERRDRRESASKRQDYGREHTDGALGQPSRPIGS